MGLAETQAAISRSRAGRASAAQPPRGAPALWSRRRSQLLIPAFSDLPERGWALKPGVLKTDLSLLLKISASDVHRQALGTSSSLHYSSGTAARPPPPAVYAPSGLPPACGVGTGSRGMNGLSCDSHLPDFHSPIPTLSRSWELRTSVIGRQHPACFGRGPFF